MLFAGVVLALSLNQNLMAQGNGGGGGGGRGQRMDPAQRMAQRLDSIRQSLEITGDDEWKAIQPLVEKVVTAQNESRAGNFGGGRGGRGGRGQNGQGGANAAPATPRPGAIPNPEADALRQALDAKAPAAEITAKLSALRASQKAKEAKLEAARESLSKVLSVRQEAIAVQLGLLR